MATLQGGTVNLQGGTGISLGAANPQSSSSNPIQPASNVNNIIGGFQNTVNSADKFLNANQSQYNDLLAKNNSLLQQIAALNQKTYAPTIDFSAINAQARSQAEGAVNPLYTKYLNDFIAQQNFQKQTQQAQTATNIKNLQDTLAQTLAGNATTGQRAIEDTGNKIGQIGTQADQYQTDQGKSFEAGRLALGTQIAQSGLGNTGLGAQQQQESVINQDTAEARQADQFQQARDQANLLKSRTLEDIMTSNQQAKTAETKGETAANFNLDTYIKQQAFDLTNKRNDLETQRQAALASETANRTSALVRAFVNSITNPAARQAALQAYGNLI